MMKRSFMILFFLALSLVLYSQESASISLGEELKYDEVFVFRYTLSQNFNNQKHELKLTFTSRDNRMRPYLVRLQAGTHKLYWHASQFDAPVAVVFLKLQKTTQKSETLNLKDLNIVTRVEKTKGQVPTISLDDMFLWKDAEHDAGHGGEHDAGHDAGQGTEQDTEQPYDFSIFRWQQHPDVLMLFFRDREQQAQYLKRAAFFIEKRGTRGSLPYDHEIQHRRGWGAHDYDAEDLRTMFEEGRTKKFPTQDSKTKIFPFGSEELQLKRLLIEQGHFILSKADRRFFASKAEDPVFLARVPIQAATGSVVSIAKTYSPQLIRILIFHELLHTFYFTDKELRSYVAQQWMQLSTVEQQLWKSFLAKNGYDETYDYLVQNEFFAYLLQRPVSVLGPYIQSRILKESDIKLSKDEIAVFVEHMKRRSLLLSSYMQQHYGISDGELRFVRRLK